MGRIRSALGYAWAAMAIPIVLATFMGMGFWAHELVSVTGVKVSPRFTGGEVARTIDRGGYEIRIHRPVFDGLFGERAEGFVQVIWTPKTGQLPAEITDDLDLDGDGSNDCTIRLNTRSNDVSLAPRSRIVVCIREKLTFDRERGVRISLFNPKS